MIGSRRSYRQRTAQGSLMPAIMSTVLFLPAIVLAWMGYQVLSGRKQATRHAAAAPVAGGSGGES